MATEAEKRKLEAIRNDLSMVGIDWSVAADSNGILSLIVKDPADGEPRTIAVFAGDVPFSFQDFLMRAGDRQQFLVEMLDRCARAYRELASKQPKPTNHAAEVAMKCKSDQQFRQWLIDCQNMTDAKDFERVKTHVRFLLAVGSLKDLNEDQAAAGRWKKMREDFEKWRKRQ